jgi:ribosomal protein L13E
MNGIELWVDRLQVIAHEREVAYGRHAQRVQEAALILESGLARLSKREAAVMAMGQDPVVLVRNSVGAPLSKYHEAERPCGAARGRGFTRMLEGEARQAGLRRCRHCHWSVARAEQVSA